MSLKINKADGRLLCGIVFALMMFAQAGSYAAEPTMVTITPSWEGNCMDPDGDIGLHNEVSMTFSLITNASVIITVSIKEGGNRDEAYTATWSSDNGSITGEGRYKTAKAFLSPDEPEIKLNIKDGGTTWPNQSEGEKGADMCVELISEKAVGCFIQDITFEQSPLPSSESTVASAVVKSYGSTCDVKWMIYGDKRDCGIGEYGEGKAKITAGCESGYITVRAYLSDTYDPDDHYTYAEKQLLIGDDCKACMPSGAAKHNVGSIRSVFSMGAGLDGVSAGAVVLRAETWTPHVLHPNMLQYSVTRDDVEVLRDNYRTIRQIRYPEGLLDVQVTAVNAYSMDFYTNQFSTTDTNDYYIVSTATPVVKYQISTTGNSIWNPYASQNLVINEIRGGSTNTTVYFYVPGPTNKWALSEGNGLRFERLQRWTNSTEKIEIRTIEDASSNVAYKVHNTYLNTTNYGYQLVRQAVDPDGVALITSNEYDSVSGRLTKTVDPGGSVRTMAYDANGHVAWETRTWADESLRMVSNTYATVGIELSRPRQVVETIDGFVTSKTLYDYFTDGGGDRVETIERFASTAGSAGNPDNLVATNIFYAVSTNASSEKIKFARQPDGRITHYTYEFGELILTNAAAGEYGFEPGTGLAIRVTATHATVASSNGIPGKSLREITVQSPTGVELVRETQIYTGSGHARVDWHISEVDHYGHVTKRYFPNGTHEESSWSICCGKEWEEDRVGLLTSYTYDDLKRVMLDSRGGVLHAYTRDAEGRVLTRTRSAGGLIQVSSNVYDVAGRMVQSVDEQGLETSWTYEEGGRITTRTLPGGATEITETYKDGRVKSVTGTGVPHRHYEYGVESNGFRWTKVFTGPDDSPMWERTTTDPLGRTVLVERPDFGGAQSSVTEYFYNNKGQLIRIAHPHRADILYEYDELGNQTASGLDMNGNGVLNRASTDRVTEADAFFEVDGADAFRVTVNVIYPTDGSGNPVTNSVVRERLLGWSGNLAEERVMLDIRGNLTVSRREIIRNEQKEIQATEYPDSAITETQLMVNGLLVSQLTKTGLTYSNRYDALRRVEETIAPNGGRQAVVYDDKGRVQSVLNAASNTVSYGYNALTGQRIAVTNALGGTTYFSYDVRGNMTNTWGTAAYPISYEYSDEGRMVSMTTYRDDNGPGDVTTWLYDQATGLLTNKLYADGNGPSYTYTADGLLAERKWARGIITTYQYDIAGGLTNVHYSDATPSVSYAYDRLGRRKTATDAAGSWSFAYDPETLDLQEESVQGLYTHILARQVDALGRPSGVSLSNAAYEVAYAYDTVGRFTAVTSHVDGITSSFIYAYAPDAAVIATMMAYNGQTNVLTVARDHDVLSRLTEIENQGLTGILSRYQYGYDALDRRTNVLLHAGDYWNYDYNARSEVTNAVRRWSDHVPVLGQTFGYSYDDIGNRETSSRDEDTSAYWANDLNQYTNRTVPGVAHVLGTASTNADVWINMDAADRQGGYFHKALPVDNTNGAAYPLIRVLGVNLGAGPGGEDVMSVETGRLYVAQSPQAFEYDLDGNLTFDGRWTYVWDGENRLVEVRSNGTPVVVNEYDYMSRRIMKSTVTGTNTYVYDSWNLLAEMGDASPSSRYYVWGLDLSQTLQGAGGVGGLLAILTPGSGFLTPAYDANGNITDLVDADGNVVAHYEYDPYGNTIAQSGDQAEANPFRFSSKYWDGETGFYYYGFRFHSPALGRWINRDTLGELGGYNLLSFAENDSINNIDLLGLKVRILGEDEVVKRVLGSLEKFIRGSLSVDPNGFLDRKITPPDCSACPGEGDIEKWIDQLIASANQYEIDVTDDTGFLQGDGSFTQWSGGGTIKVDPCPSDHYFSDSGFYKRDVEYHNFESLLAHELLGRAYAHCSGENGADRPANKLDEKTKNKLNTLAVKRANEAFARLGMKPRCRY